MPSAVIGSGNSIENGSFTDEYERIFREDNPTNKFGNTADHEETHPKWRYPARLGNPDWW